MIPQFLTKHSVRNMSEREARHRFATFDLSIVSWKLSLPKGDGEGWGIKKIQRVERLYRQWLFLYWKYPHLSNVPSKEVDIFFHNHILFTKKYVRDCEYLFGRYAHHNPDFGMPKMTKKFLKQMYG